MPRLPKLLFLGLATIPMFVFAGQQAAEPKAEEVFKNIKVFKGMPARDVIPAMEFMSASLGWKCEDCHNTENYAEETNHLETAREMVEMQREINTKFFNGRLETTCMTCHNGKGHPATFVAPQEVALNHKRIQNGPKPADLFGKHVAAAGKAPAMLTRKGTLTAPSLADHKEQTKALEVIQAGNKYKMASEGRDVVSNGTKTWYGPTEIADEPAAIFGRIGRLWVGEGIFGGLESATLMGEDKIGDKTVYVVRAVRKSTHSNEELYFDSTSNLLVRQVNVRPTSIGTVISKIDYSDYKSVEGAMVPMKVVVTFANHEKWTLSFDSAKVDTSATDSIFAPPPAKSL